MNYNDGQDNSLSEFSEESCITTIAVVLFALVAVIFVSLNAFGIKLSYLYLAVITATLFIIFVIDQLFKKLYWSHYVDKRIEEIERDSS